MLKTWLKSRFGIRQISEQQGMSFPFPDWFLRTGDSLAGVKYSTISFPFIPVRLYSDHILL